MKFVAGAEVYAPWEHSSLKMQNDCIPGLYKGQMCSLRRYQVFLNFADTFIL